MSEKQPVITIRNCEFVFKCPNDWRSLRIASNGKVGFCDACQKQVFLCATPDELDWAIRNKLCVAVRTPEKTTLMGLPKSSQPSENF